MMKQILFIALAVLFFSCGTTKKNTQDNDAQTVAQKTTKKPLPPNTTSNKYSKKRLIKNQ